VKTLVIGTGGREHALALGLAQDAGVTEVHAAPGNPGMGDVAALHEVDPMDGAAVASLASSLDIDLVVIGPEAPLVAGVADAVRTRGIAVYGPSGRAAQLEGSKAFSKDVMAARACRRPGPGCARPRSRRLLRLTSSVRHTS
jgi:phosphoribosylamine--glycine ligase